MVANLVAFSSSTVDQFLPERRFEFFAYHKESCLDTGLLELI